MTEKLTEGAFNAINGQNGSLFIFGVLMALIVWFVSMPLKELPQTLANTNIQLAALNEQIRQDREYSESRITHLEKTVESMKTSCERVRK